MKLILKHVPAEQLFTLVHDLFITTQMAKSFFANVGFN